MATSPSPKPRNIAIVGAGLGGLALALFLHRSNPSLSLTILELRPQSATDGGFLALAPNALHVLNQLGLYESLLPHGYAYEELRFYSARNLSVLGRFLNGSREKFGYPALRIERHTVRQTLIKAVLASGIPIRFETKVTSVRENLSNHSVSLELANGSEESYDLVIGADGIHSRIRQLISTVQPTYSGQVGLGGGKIPRSSIDPDIYLPAMFMGKSNGFAIMPTTADGATVSCFATLEMEPRLREEWADVGRDKEGLKEMLVEKHCGEGSEWPEVIQRACREGKVESFAIWPFFNAPVLESWSTPSARVVLLGDAAHAMPPTGGQGAAQALEDAASLARSIIASSGSSSLQENIQTWQAERQERVRKIKAFTSKGGDMRKASASTLQQIVKEWAIWLWMWWVGKEGGLGWAYEHREEGPKVEMREA
jgi:2-polyprenyl-6-methoxyphenol hydroxylase-like FAD-dependent oxidoreductase